MKKREIERITTSHLQQGFLGEGHRAAAVIDSSNFAKTDPFILLMDDRLDLPGGEPVGGPHPHAGFETVTFVVEGNDKDWKTGSLELMTAGKGIIHTEEISSRTKLRILQLWLALPPENRWAEPRLQQILPEDVPSLITGKSEISVYSGTSNGLTSALQNHTPFTMVDFKMKPDAEAGQQIPADYNGFIYVINGRVLVGGKTIEQGQAGWFNTADDADESEISFRTTDQDARFILYAGRPHHAQIVSHGPFIGDSQEDIIRLYAEYRAGKLPHLSNLPDSRKFRYKKTA